MISKALIDENREYILNAPEVFFEHEDERKQVLSLLSDIANNRDASECMAFLMSLPVYIQLLLDNRILDFLHLWGHEIPYKKCLTNAT